MRELEFTGKAAYIYRGKLKEAGGTWDKVGQCWRIPDTPEARDLGRLLARKQAELDANGQNAAPKNRNTSPSSAAQSAHVLICPACKVRLKVTLSKG